MESKWHFPSTVQELVDVIDRDNPLIHGGGTGIPRAKVRSSKSVVDLSRMGWDRCKVEDRSIRLGSMCTFSKAVRELGALRPGHILVRSLGASASTALRNRITLGGSVAFFPLWSDLVGPLLALRASVDLVGASEGVYPLKEFVSNRSLFKGSVIRSISIPDETWDSWYYREVRVGFDYPGFTVAMLARRSDGCLEDFRAVVVGTKDRFSFLDGVMDDFKGKRYGEIDVTSLGDSLGLEFPDKKSGSGDYFRQVAAVWFERGLSELLER